MLEIVPYNPNYDEDFARLNFAWLEKYFYVEDYDREVLTKPKQYIIDKGGHIYYALLNGKVAGTTALIQRDPGVYELSKMAVSKEFQGKRIGQKLMYFCINKAGELGAETLFLDSNKKLIPAISLYRKVGFREIPVPSDTPYERCNIRMEIKI